MEKRQQLESMLQGFREQWKLQPARRPIIQRQARCIQRAIEEHDKANRPILDTPDMPVFSHT